MDEIIFVTHNKGKIASANRQLEGVDSMLYLKKVNFEDIEEEYKAIKSMPTQENGFENKYHSATKEEFLNEVIPKLLKNSEGTGLPDGYVPDTYFFLWDDDKIVGLFKIRHYLNDFLRKGAGHMGYGILPEYRGRGYAKKGLVLAIEKCKEIIKEDEVYLSVHKDNPASLRVQLSCGAFIVGETDEEYLTRIKLKDNNINFGFRDLRRDDWKRITQKEVIVDDEVNEFFEGKVCYLDMQEVESSLSVESPVGEVTIANNKYKNLIFAPKNKNWWLTVIFDNQDSLIESYFDITRINDFSNPDNPYYVDMKLDVCIPNGHEPTIMDEEELKEVYEHGLITKDDFENAYNTANRIISTYNSHKEDYYKYVNSMYHKYKNKYVGK